MIVTGEKGKEFNVIASGEDAGCLQHLQIYISGGEFKNSAGTNINNDKTNSTEKLIATGSLQPLMPGQAIKLWAVAEDYHGNSQRTGNLILNLPATWSIQLENLIVFDANEDDLLSDGDEPYFILMGFRSKFDVPGSTTVWSTEYLDDDWAAGIDAGQSESIPTEMGTLSFPNIEPGFFELSDINISDVEYEIVSQDPLSIAIKDIRFPPVEFVGGIAIALESDYTSWSDIRTLREKFRADFEDYIRDIFETNSDNNKLSLPEALLESLKQILTKPINNELAKGDFDPDKISEVVKNVLHDEANQNIILSSFEAGIKEPDFNLSPTEMLTLLVSSGFDPDDIIGTHVFFYIVPDSEISYSLKVLENEGISAGKLEYVPFQLSCYPLKFIGEGANYTVTGLVYNTEIDIPAESSIECPPGPHPEELYSCGDKEKCPCGLVNGLCRVECVPLDSDAACP